MWVMALAGACLGCTSHGRRAHVSSDMRQRSSSEEHRASLQAAEAFARLLTAFSPAAGWQTDAIRLGRDPSLSKPNYNHASSRTLAPVMNTEMSRRSMLAAGVAGAMLLQPQSTLAAATETNDKADFKLQGGGASTLQSGRRITITRGVNLDNTDWKGENLKGVAFQQSVVRSSNFDGANLESASFFDADLAMSSFKDANMNLCNLEMADLSNADLTGADLTNAYVTGAVLNGPKGGLTKIDNTDWTDAELRKDQRSYLCSLPAKGSNPKTGMDTRVSLMCPDALK